MSEPTAGATDVERWRLQIERGSTEEQHQACERLVTRPDDEAIAARLVHTLLGRLKADAAPVKTAALRAVRRVWRPGDAGLAEVFAAALDGDTSLVRGAAVDALSERLAGDEAERRTARGLVAAALRARHVQSVSLARQLDPALSDASADAAASERDRLERLGDLLTDGYLGPGAAAALGDLGPRAVGAIPALRAAIGAGDPAVALAALEALLHVSPGSPEAVDAIERALARAEPGVVLGALEVCHERLHEGPTAAMRQVLSPARLRIYLERGQPDAWQAIASALLGELGGPDDVDPLLDLLEWGTGPVMIAAHDALAALDRRGLLPLERLLSWSKAGPRRPSRSLHLIGEHADEDPRACEWLLHLGLDGPSASERGGALRVLRDHANDAIRDRLADQLSLTTPLPRRLRALEALATVGPRAAHRDRLVERLHDPDARIRKRACKALVTLTLTTRERPPLELFLGLIERLTDADIQDAVRAEFRRLRHLAPTSPPASLPLAELLEGRSIDWAGLFERLCCQSPPTPHARAWHDLFAARTRWWSQLLHRPAPEVPSGLWEAGQQMVSLANEHRRRHLSPTSRPDEHGAERERVRALVQAWRQEAAHQGYDAVR